MPWLPWRITQNCPRRYESETERKRTNKPLFSVVLDEFAPFGYRNFSQILNTARATNTTIALRTRGQVVAYADQRA